MRVLNLLPAIRLKVTPPPFWARSKKILYEKNLQKINLISVSTKTVITNR